MAAGNAQTFFLRRLATKNVFIIACTKKYHAAKNCVPNEIVGTNSLTLFAIKSVGSSPNSCCVKNTASLVSSPVEKNINEAMNSKTALTLLVKRLAIYTK